jgi:uncharacterized membrane protein YjjP (DUF1212 family)
VLRYITEAGCALLGASTPSSTVGPAMRELARGYGVEVEVEALPEGVLSVASGTGRSFLATARTGSLRFDQTERLFDLIQRSRGGGVSALQGVQELHAIEGMAPTVAAGWRFMGYWLIAVGLCLRRNPGVAELAVTAALGMPVAALLIGAPRLGGLKPFMPAVAAFVVGVPVSLLVEQHRLAEPSQVVVPLLASFIPGLLLAVGSLELLRGAFEAGAARFIGGIYQLVVLAFGLVASEAAFALNAPTHPVASTAQVGAWAPVVGVGVYTVGLWLAFCAPVTALPALAVVVYAAWGIQQLADPVTDRYVSTFLAATVGVVIAQAIYAWFGPPPLLTINPLFRILGPGGLSLERVTALTAGNFLGADTGVVVFTLIAVAMGLAAGMAISDHLRLGPTSR